MSRALRLFVAGLVFGMATLLWSEFDGRLRAAEHPDARTTAVDVNPFRLNPSGRGILATESATPMAHLEFRTSVVGQYLTDPMVVQRQRQWGENRSLVSQRQQLDLSVAVGLFDRVEVGAHLPATLNQTAMLPGYDLGSASSSGLGNASMYGFVNIVSEDQAPLSVGVGAPVGFPTHSADGYFGGDGFSLTPRLRLSSHVGPVRMALNGGARLQRETRVNNLSDGHRAELRGGLMLKTSPRWGVGVELMGSSPLTAPFTNTAASRAELLAGGHFRPVDVFDIHAAVGRGVVRGVGAPGLRGVVGVSLHLNRPAQGGPCEQAVGKQSPSISPEECPDADFDTDGRRNAVDECPLEAEDVDGYRDDDGCPDLDNDEDGIPDPSDDCPNVPEDTDGYQDGDGCPDTDNDGDGFADGEDECPNSPEDFDGFEDDDGCAERDNDNDAVADFKDECPQTAGPFENQGCPKQEAPEAKVVEETETIELSEKIFFVTDRAIIRQQSYDVLEKVGEVLKENPDIQLVEIGGYADQRGKSEYNYHLSWERAKVVRLYLIHNADIDPTRLRAAGFGEVESDDSSSEEEASEGSQSEAKEAWAKDRKVEFKMLRRSDD